MTEKRVEHRTYGWGVVKGKRYQGNEFLIEFQDGIGRWIPAREIKVSESDILKSAILGLQKSNRLNPLITKKTTYQPSDPLSDYPESQPVSHDLFEDLTSDSLPDNDLVPEKKQGKNTGFDLFEPEPNQNETPAGTVEYVHEHDKPNLANEALHSTINDLLKKAHDLEHTSETKIIPKDSDRIRTSESNTPKSRFKIRIIEEPIISAETEDLHNRSKDETFVREFHITEKHVLFEDKPLQQPQSVGDEHLQPSAAAETQGAVTVSDTTTALNVNVISVPDQSNTRLSDQDISITDIDKKILATPVTKTDSATRQTRPCSPDRFEARRVIEALRLGVVPHKKIEDFSCGRETESEIVETWLGDPEKACMFFSGEYGSGKSHMLEISAAKALKNNWAVAIIEIDPDESPFNQPKKIYRQIIRSFVYQDEENLLGFRDFILKILNSEKKKKIETLREHPFLGSLLKAWHEMSEDTIYCLTHDKTDLLLWIEGEEINPPGLPRLHGYQNSANTYCNLLSGLGWAARHIAGLRGLLILIDEGEGIDKGWYSAYQFYRAGNFIKGLVLMANSEKILHEEYDYMKRYAFPRGNKNGKYTELLYGGTSKHVSSFLWQDESHVKILFSFTPYIVPFVYENIIKDEEICRKIPEIALEELREKDLELLYHKIHLLYNSAYEFSSKNSIFPTLPKDKTRLFVKSVVETLDVMRFNPDTYREELGIG